MFFAQKLFNLGPVLNKPLLLKRVTEWAQLVGDFRDFAAKIAILRHLNRISHVLKPYQ